MSKEQKKNGIYGLVPVSDAPALAMAIIPNPTGDSVEPVGSKKSFQG